jgi:hypothetical protein
MNGSSPQVNSIAIFMDPAITFNIEALKKSSYFVIIDSTLSQFVKVESKCFAAMNYCYLLDTFEMKSHFLCLTLQSCLAYLFFL